MTKNRALLYLGILTFASVVIFCTYQFFQMNDSRSFIKVNAEIGEIEIASWVGPGKSGHKNAQLFVDYTYLVNGQPYSSEQIEASSSLWDSTKNRSYYLLNNSISIEQNLKSFLVLVPKPTGFDPSLAVRIKFSEPTGEEPEVYVDKKQSVYVNPENPQESFLVKKSTAWMLLAIAGSLLLIALALLFRYLRKSSSKEQ